MKQAICGFGNDEHDDWVAHLVCGHNQHVRHNPPWQVREWTQTLEGRNSMLGFELNCVKCDEGAAPDRPTQSSTESIWQDADDPAKEQTAD